MKSVFYDKMIAKVFHLIVYLQSLSYTSKVKDENVKKKKPRKIEVKKRIMCLLFPAILRDQRSVRFFYQMISPTKML